MHHPLAVVIPLPFTIPIWLLIVAGAIWLIVKIYEIFVTKPRERQNEKDRKRDF